MNYAKYFLFVFIFAAGISAAPKDVLAAEYFATQGEAAAACEAAKPAAYSNPHCDHTSNAPNPGGQYVCRYFTNDWCGTFIYDVACPSDDGYSWMGDANVCIDGCVYSAHTSTCIGSECLNDGAGTGGTCSGEPIANPPDGCTLENDVVVCDCTANPSASFCPGGDPGPDPDDCFFDAVSGQMACYAPDDPDHPVPPPPTEGGGDPGGDPTDSGGADSNNSGGASPGDGNPDTPENPGEGDGDVDEDGERDIDCNPLSNSDCAYAGSASAVSVCGAPPTCTGDPVQCAQLTQQYNIMCAVLTASDNERKNRGANSAQESNDCNTPPSCNSNDPVQCAIIRQSWENSCRVTDVGSEKAPWEYGAGAEGDIYNKDLASAENVKDIDISTGINTSGFASGSCPAPIAVSTSLVNFSIDFTYVCELAGMIRFFLILFSLMGAGWFVVRAF